MSICFVNQGFGNNTLGLFLHYDTFFFGFGDFCYVYQRVNSPRYILYSNIVRNECDAKIRYPLRHFPIHRGFCSNSKNNKHKKSTNIVSFNNSRYASCFFKRQASK